jgi:hypothetical protein
MDEYFATMAVNNSTVVCVGGITKSETDAARDDGMDIDGFGYYLFLANESAPAEPVEILAKFVSENQAARFAQMIGRTV